MSVNKVIVLGRLGQDPEIKYTDSGASVCNFSVATSEHWQDKSGQKQEKTEWHRIVIWGKLAEVCNQYLSKGRQVYLEGKVQTRSWDDKDGKKIYTTELNCNVAQFIGGKGDADDTQKQEPKQEKKTEGVLNNEYTVGVDPAFTADDIPF